MLPRRLFFGLVTLRLKEFPVAGIPRQEHPSFRPHLEGLEARLVPATFTVENVANGGLNSLRWAITEANATAGPNTIDFAIPGTGTKVIALLSPLPTIDNAATVNGTTQSGFSNAPLIELYGASAGAGANGLVIAGANASNCLIEGLILERFSGNGIVLETSGNAIQSCYVGTNAPGTIAEGNGENGILVEGTASKNTIGGTTLIDRNLISGNTRDGVLIEGSSATDNVVENNYIGTNAAGTFALFNRYSGVEISQGSTGNTIGGNSSATSNFIAGNSHYGVELDGTGTSNNAIEGNGITSNGLGGIDISAGASKNEIGIVNAGNVVSGNHATGILLSGTGVTGNSIEGNAIGTNGSEDGALANAGDGIEITQGASDNTIGAGTAGADNVISGNSGFGIVISSSGTTGNVVANNFIGTDATGTVDIANTDGGVEISAAATHNTIGGSVAGTTNLISGNGKFGILVESKGTTGNVVEGNVVGLSVAGTAALPNAGGGIEIDAAADNSIGGTTAAERNVISGNKGSGLAIEGIGASGNTIQGNYVGTDEAGTAAAPNTVDGIDIFAGASDNTVGGAVAGAGNLISGNAASGVHIYGSGTSGNTLLANTIGLNATEAAALPNGTGISVSANANTIGGTGTGDGNAISGNKGVGILIVAARLNLIEGNAIGTLVGSKTAFGNGGHGVFITDGAADNIVGGTATGDANTIADNGGVGVLIGEDATAGYKVEAGAGNAVLGNSIYANAKLGIDLGPDKGVLANHSGGLAVGPNHYQNYAAVSSATISADGTQIAVDVTLTSVPNTNYRIEVFANVAADASGYGQGQTFLGFIDVTTNASGTATGSTTFSYASTMGTYISTTTTNEKTEDTSEFGKSVLATT